MRVFGRGCSLGTSGGGFNDIFPCFFFFLSKQQTAALSEITLTTMSTANSIDVATTLTHMKGGLGKNDSTSSSLSSHANMKLKKGTKRLPMHDTDTGRPPVSSNTMRSRLSKLNAVQKSTEYYDRTVYPLPEDAENLKETITPYTELPAYSRSIQNASFAYTRPFFPAPDKFHYHLPIPENVDSFNVGDWVYVLYKSYHGRKVGNRLVKSFIIDFKRHTIILNKGLTEQDEIRTKNHPGYRGDLEPSLYVMKETETQIQKRIKENKNTPEVKRRGGEQPPPLDDMRMVDHNTIVVARNPTHTHLCQKTLNTKFSILGTVDYSVKDRRDSEKLKEVGHSVYMYLDDLPPNEIPMPPLKRPSSIDPLADIERKIKRIRDQEKIYNDSNLYEDRETVMRSAAGGDLYDHVPRSHHELMGIRKGSLCTNIKSYLEERKKLCESKYTFICPLCPPEVTYSDDGKQYTLSVPDHAIIIWEPKNGKVPPKSFGELEWSVVAEDNRVFIEHNKHENVNHVPLFQGFDMKLRNSDTCRTVGSTIHVCCARPALEEWGLPCHLFQEGNMFQLHTHLAQIWASVRSNLNRKLTLKPDNKGFQQERSTHFALLSKDNELAPLWKKKCFEYWEDVNNRIVEGLSFGILSEDNVESIYAWNAVNLFLLEGHVFKDTFHLFGYADLKNRQLSLIDVCYDLYEGKGKGGCDANNIESSTDTKTNGSQPMLGNSNTNNNCDSNNDTNNNSESDNNDKENSSTETENEHEWPQTISSNIGLI